MLLKRYEGLCISRDQNTELASFATVLYSIIPPIYMKGKEDIYTQIKLLRCLNLVGEIARLA